MYQAGSEISSLLERLPSAVGYQPTLSYEMGAFQERIGSTKDGSITSIQAVYYSLLMTLLTLQLLRHSHTSIQLSYLIEISLLQDVSPAVNPLESTSKLLARGYVSDAHFDTASKVLTILEELNQLQDVIMILGMSGLNEDDKRTVATARRLQNFLTQPFIVAEKFSGMPGATVPLASTVESFSRVITGELNHIPEKFFLYKGTIDEVIREYEKWKLNASDDEKQEAGAGPDIDKVYKDKKSKRNAKDKAKLEKQMAKDKKQLLKDAGLEKTTIIDISSIDDDDDLDGISRFREKETRKNEKETSQKRR